MRRTLSQQAVQNVLLNSKRRCCLCFVDGNDELRTGAIAQLNSSSQKDTEDNLVFLCADHHYQFDKGELQIGKIREARAKLYQAMGQSLEYVDAEHKQPWREFEEKAQAILMKEFKDSMGRNTNIYCNRIYKGCSGNSREVDLSAELVAAGFKLLVVVEIKYAKRKISIPDLDAFTAKVKDIGADKGVFVTNSGFSESAVRFANTNGIALIHLKEEADHIIANTLTDSLYRS